MSTDIIMPQMGESITEGTIVTWHKKPGDFVKKDEPLFLISTDKIESEVESPGTGYLSEVAYQEGDTVAIETVLAKLTEEPGQASSTPAPMATDPTPETSKAHASDSLSSPTKDVQATATQQSGKRSSPLVRKMVREHNLDLQQINGTGSHGRVTKKDVLAYLAHKPSQSQPQASLVNASKYAYKPQAQDRIERFSPMRKNIAEHMVISRDTSVHVCTVFEVDMTRAVQLRKKHKQSYLDRGSKLTYMPFIMQSVIEGLKKYPELNASIVDNQIVYKPNINLGVAVAIEDGLLVPVIPECEKKSFFGLGDALNDVALRARNKQLDPKEVTGGTFTITNPGVFGSLFGTPIINQPQVAILCVGTITKRAVVTEDDAIAIRHMMYLSMSFDHRLIDGAMADQFMATVKHQLENFPEELI